MADSGGWIFNTEAHPLDAGIIHCCSKKRHNDITLLRDFEHNIDLLSLNDDLKNMMEENNVSFSTENFLRFFDKSKDLENESEAKRFSQNGSNHHEYDRPFCLNCCTRFDDPLLFQNSQLFWYLIYLNYFGFCDSNIECCYDIYFDDDEIDEKELSEYSNQLPDLSSLPSEEQKLDALQDGFSLQKFKYLRPNPKDGQQNFSLLFDNNPFPFERNFLGLGQIV